MQTLHPSVSPVWRHWNPCTLLVGMSIGAPDMKNNMEVPQKLKIEISYDPAISLLDLHPKELKIGS